MSGSIVERYLCEGVFNPSEFKDTDWKSSMLVLGMILGIKDSKRVNLSLLLSIANNPSLDDPYRAYSLIRALEILGNQSDSLLETNKAEEANIIKEFQTISNIIFEFKNNIGSLKGSAIKVYTKIFGKLIGKFVLNKKAAILGLCGLRNVDLLECSCSLFDLSEQELETIDNYHNVDKYEIMRVLRHGCEIVLEKQYRANEALSILVFNTLNSVLGEKAFIDTDVPKIEAALLKYAPSFSPNQKKRLFENYSRICSNVNQPIDQNLSAEYSFGGKKRGNRYSAEKTINLIQNEGKDEERKQSEPLANDIKTDIAVRIDGLIADLRKQLPNTRIEVESIVKSLKNICELSESLTFAVLLDFADREQPYFLNSKLMWKLISKSISMASIFTNDQRSQLHRRIDIIVANRQ